MDLAQYSQRAELAERKVQLLMQKAEKLEQAVALLNAKNTLSSSSSSSSSVPASTVHGLLEALTTLRATVAADQVKKQGEIDRLSKENGKLHYRITHLLKHIATLEANNKTSTLTAQEIIDRTLNKHVGAGANGAIVAPE